MPEPFKPTVENQLKEGLPIGLSDAQVMKKTFDPELMMTMTDRAMDTVVSFIIRSQMNLDIKSSMDLRLEQTAALNGLQDYQHLQKQPSMSL